jgi:hypothetical protein
MTGAPRPPEGGLDRALGALCWLLPADRGGWGRAMRAELGAIEDPATRRRFAAGCARAVITMPSVLAEVAGRGLIVVVGVVATARFSGASVGVIAEATAVLLVLALLAWWAARRGPLGPVAPGRTPRAGRAGGMVAVLAVLGWFLSPEAGGAPRDPAGWWVAGTAIVLCWAGTLTLTSVGVEPRTLGATVLIAGGSVLLWALSALAAQSVSGAPTWPILVSVSAGLVACLARKRLGHPAQTARAALGAAAASAVGMFCLAAIVADLRPGPGPDSMDPMVGVLVFGALVSAIAVTIGGSGAHGSDCRAVGR